jgi:predicted DNA-binding transcriptional regulator AlpA
VLLSKTPGPRWVRNKALAEMLGVTVMSIWRWQRDATLAFPQPSEINGIQYTNIEDVERWLKARALNLVKEVA